MIFCFSITQTIHGDTWSNISWPYDIDLCVMKRRSAWRPVISPYILKTIWWINVKLLDNKSVRRNLWPKMNVSHSDLYFTISNFVLYLEDYLIYEGHTWDIGSIWHKDWPHKIYVGLWPMFHGAVILLNIFKIIWWINITVGIMDQCDTKIDLIKYM